MKQPKLTICINIPPHILAQIENIRWNKRQTRSLTIEQLVVAGMERYQAEKASNVCA
jgi:hypothetical protein